VAVLLRQFGRKHGCHEVGWALGVKYQVVAGAGNEDGLTVEIDPEIDLDVQLPGLLGH
jgi:hypothetical protein